MKIPDGIDEEKAIEVILKISKRLAPKYVFATYEIEDIEQEAFLIGVAGLAKYDKSRPLENFMYTHINNRLKTFKRDNYYRLDYGSAAQKIQDRKKSLLEPIDIDALYNICTPDNIGSQAHLNEVLKLIDEKLPPHLRRDYLKLRHNAPLPKGRKAIIIGVIENIINGEHDEKG
tara:strand:- start:92 stop:613 length:522 start_codon:yes stop_codon:yes gene_type:complete